MREIDKTLPKDQRILLAAEEVFSRRGYVQATLDEIIALADTGKGTVYKYFGNKDNLFYTLVASKIEPFLQCLQEVVASGKSTSEKSEAICWRCCRFCGTIRICIGFYGTR